MREIIEVTTGDKFCLQNHISEIDLLKIHTEGYELQVLNGFSDMLKNSKIKAIFCQVGFNPGNIRYYYINDLINFACQNNFQFYGLYEFRYKNIKSGGHYGSVLFLNNDIIKNML